MGLALCIAGFLICLLLGLRSLTAGLCGVMAVGYWYGILRANFLDTFAHFFFDSAVLGLYLSQLAFKADGSSAANAESLKRWVTILLIWVGIMFLLPLQDVLIRLVGLRGNAFMVPFLLLGARLTDTNLFRLSLFLSLLNFMALGFGIAEYVLGVPAFYPENSVTELIYRSKDIAENTAYRIPACFVNAHSYAGTMVMTIPWLMGAWATPRRGGLASALLAAGLGAAFIGVFMSGARIYFALLFVLMLGITFAGKLRAGQMIGWVLLLVGIGYVVSGEERMQRFLTLQNTEDVVGRLHGSINMGFWELMGLYPMGNGLGGGGTSVPFFLLHLIRDPVLLENEYGRILLEQGIVGLVLWLAFATWVFTRPAPQHGDPWSLGWRLMWYACLGFFGLSLLGTGLMTAIPLSSMIFMSIGVMCVRSGRRAVARQSLPSMPNRRVRLNPQLVEV